MVGGARFGRGAEYWCGYVVAPAWGASVVIGVQEDPRAVV